MTNEDDASQTPLSQLPPEEKARRASSFGGAAAQYERYRPGPPTSAVDWLLPNRVATIVDLGAGTGALTRLLFDYAEEVIAVEPDDLMRAELVSRVAGVHAVQGRGEDIPVPDGTADAVTASSSWHWMDAPETLREVARVLAPGGTLGVLWSGPDMEGPFLAQVRTLFAPPELRVAGTVDDAGEAGENVGSLILADAARPEPRLEIAPGLPFDEPERRVFRWEIALNTDELVGLLGTFSWVITLPDDRRERVIAEARRLLHDALGLVGDATVDVSFQCVAWRTHRHFT